MSEPLKVMWGQHTHTPEWIQMAILLGNTMIIIKLHQSASYQMIHDDSWSMIPRNLSSRIWDLSWCVQFRDVFQTHLVGICFSLFQVWGSLNDAAVPILGLFLLRGEDEYFFACHGLSRHSRLSRLSGTSSSWSVCICVMFIICAKFDVSYFGSSTQHTVSNMKNVNFACFACCSGDEGYERMSKIWLFNECCGLQKDVPHTQTLSDGGPQLKRGKFEKSSSNIMSFTEMKVQKPHEYTVRSFTSVFVLVAFYGQDQKIVAVLAVSRQKL